MARAQRLEPGAARIALALARAVVPPGRVFEGADESTVERLETLLSGFGPIALRGYGALLRALDVMSRGARGAAFTRLDRDEAEELLLRWSDGGPVRRGVQMALTTPVKLAYYDDHAVYERLGGAWAFTSAAEPARWKSQITTGSEIEDDVDVECDVVVVGTGAGGAVVAKELADRGHAVVMLEEGDYHGRDAFTGRGAENVQQFYRDRGATGSVGNTVIPIPMGRMVGGSTAINTGTCWRTPDWILQGWVEGGLTDRAHPRLAAITRLPECAGGQAGCCSDGAGQAGANGCGHSRDSRIGRQSVAGGRDRLCPLPYHGRRGFPARGRDVVGRAQEQYPHHGRLPIG